MHGERLKESSKQLLNAKSISEASKLDMIRPGMVGHTCNSSYSGGRGRKIMVQGWPQEISRPDFKNKLKKKDWGHGSSERMPA
jgi:hypothetical protein